MQIEKQVISLETAKKLKELGIEKESLFYWQLNEANPYYIPKIPVYGNPRDKNLFAIPFPAYTSAELGEMLYKVWPEKKPLLFQEFYSHELDVCWKTNHPFVTEGKDILVIGVVKKMSEAEARGKMLIYFIEKGFITPDEINKEA